MNNFEARLKHEFACNVGKVTEYEVKKHIDTIMVGMRGFSKEVTIAKWSDKEPAFDIRAWRVSERDGLLIVVSEMNGVELEELVHRILEKGIEEQGFYV